VTLRQQNIRQKHRLRTFLISEVLPPNVPQQNVRNYLVHNNFTVVQITRRWLNCTGVAVVAVAAAVLALSWPASLSIHYDFARSRSPLASIFETRDRLSPPLFFHG
jgi:hypothetical protein